MKLASKVVLLGALLLLAASAAYAAAPVVVAIPDFSLNAGAVTTINVVAFDADGDNITLTSSLPAWATLNGPTTGAGLVSTTITLNPTASDLGTVTGSVTATANGETDLEEFILTVNASGTNTAPVVTAPASQTVNEGSTLTFTVTASDADADLITALSAASLPAGATFTANASFTSGTFTWMPTSTQSGDYDVVFTASNALSGTATTHIHVVDVTSGNTAPDVTAPSTQTVNEGSTLSFTVSATDANSDHVTLTATGVPSGASFTDNGNNTGTFSWMPGSTQSGTYTVTFTGNDGLGGTDVATTVITVNDVSGGGGTDATAKLLGAFNSHRKFLCFRITPVNGAFDVRNADLTSIQLSFGGATIDNLSGKTSLDWECEGDDDDDDHDATALHRDGDWGDDGDCGECDHEDCPSDTTDCTVTLRACFSMTALRDLFGDQSIPDNLVNATITGELTTGGTFTATMGTPKVAGNDGSHGDKGQGHEKHALHAKATPNPLNPMTKLTFTLSQAGRVRVNVYDARGRFVKTLLDENRFAGEQTVTWDGSNARSRKVSSGVYMFRIVAPEAQDIQRVTVLK